jgi:predicted permease
MIWLLRLAFSAVLVIMLCVTGWASAQVPLWQTPHQVLVHPWFVATLFDTYFAFLTFYAWLAYRERTALARIIWLVAILLLGNIAMATYMLQLLWRVPANAGMTQILLRPGLRHGA